MTHTTLSRTNHSTKLPDFIGCREFRTIGKGLSSACSLVSLPVELQGADTKLVDNLVSNARKGIWPPYAVHNVCSPLSFSFSGSHCPSNIHGYEAVPVEKIVCGVRYHFFFSSPASSMKFVIVVGTGIHNHCPPVISAPMNKVRPLVNSTLSSNRTASTRDLCEIVENTLGAKAPINSIIKLRHQLRSRETPNGTNIEAITREYIRRVTSGESNYIISVSDERVQDRGRVSSDEVGISIVLCNQDLLKHSLKHPRYGCDGTFNTVSKLSCDGLDFELNTIISKDPKTDKCYAVMRQIASRKTKGARKDLFKHFTDLLFSFGLQNPLKCNNDQRISFTTDFETTYAIALSEILADRIPSYDKMVNHRDTILQAICFGCNVHAHRSIQTKVDRAVDSKLYNWGINSRAAENLIEVEHILQEMEAKGDNWKTFASWLRKNSCASTLWFTHCHKHEIWEGTYPGVFLDTNGNESFNERLKGSTDYLLSRGNGLSLVHLVNFLEKEDARDAKNILNSSGLQYMGSSKRKSSSNRGKNVSASKRFL